MKLINVSRDQKYLYIQTDEGSRKQSLNWRGVDQLEKKCRSLIGHEIIHTTSGAWDKDVWFQDVTLNKAAQNVVPIGSDSSMSFDGQFSLGKTWASRSVRRIYGPPGTGKTTKLVNIAKAAIEGGIRPEDIGYFAFTNVAADEARDRIANNLDLEPARFANFSTLHSLTTRMGGNEGKSLCQKEHLQRFDSNIGTREEWLRAGDPFSVVVRPEHPVLSQYSIMFNRKQQKPTFEGKSLDDALSILSRYYGLIIDTSRVAEFTEKYFQEYEFFKKSNNLADFNDVIFSVAKASFPAEKIPTFELLIIDEAQDLSALQWDVVTKLSSKAKETIIAGDDDQAIMESFGAAPHLFNEFPTTVPDEVLPVSYRLPRNIKNFVDKHVVPKLGNRSDRKHKEWSENVDAIDDGEVIRSITKKAINPSDKPVPEPLSINKLLRIIEAFKDEEWLIMAPTRATCNQISTGLAALKVPHFCHRQDVLGTDNKIHVQTIHTSKGMGSDNAALVSVSRGDSFLLDKDARLLYVALTRAKKRLFIANR
ncbi:UvrD-helicase domain-containing protein [Polaromonas vacuolata]|uniref:UvrD-helicase domain-containing protein n=1 Tax=Polaromonas vacuolata TaxID=37448 RepID=UPI0014577D82|nr:UvrD-helicase domain-containing protein [Polaromonas vacuolata]